VSTSTPTQGEFRLVGIDHAPLAHLFELTDEQLRAKHAVRRGAQQRTLAPGEVPPYVTRRLISMRAYDAGHMMVAATVCEGPEVADEIVARFVDPDVAYVHLHNAKQGCFSCLAVRS